MKNNLKIIQFFNKCKLNYCKLEKENKKILDFKPRLTKSSSRIKYANEE
jgi:hypothetical protein